MDRGAVSSRRRQQGTQPSSKPPVRIARDKRPRAGSPQRRPSGKIRTAKDSNEINRVPQKDDITDRPSVEDESNARHFTVTNVGRNGTLYLKPTRMTPAHITHAPATPPTTSDGQENAGSEWPLERQSVVSGTYTPRTQPAGINGPSHQYSAPPLSMANVGPRRRTRSHSFLTIDTSGGPPTLDSNNFYVLLNGRDTSQRPKSSVDLSGGYLDLRIPHYKLGTPRFSDRGTAYLHNSIYNSTTSDLRSSVLSRAEYDKLFPAPPGTTHRQSSIPRHFSSPFLHPSHATLTPSRTPPTPTGSPLDSIQPEIYDKVESNINDPMLVRYSPATGCIIAATTARLIAQITSPIFLDYELLADFFLTFRSFLSSRELLEYLLARMKWALSNNGDAGRIVRVRTFVALRHWILNYFPDDFMSDISCRARFCNLVNDLAQSLRQRADRGGTDINVIGELKKCWRRTCAMYWPLPDALDKSADADIYPGQGHTSSAFGASTTSLPLSNHRNASRLDFRRSSMIRLPSEPEKIRDHVTFQSSGPDIEYQPIRKASIPASPMSEQSLTILSCSVPFLKDCRPMKAKFTASLCPDSQRKPALLEKPGKLGDGHKRSGSFSDALRDRRPPLPSTRPESVDVRSLPTMTFIGGLVRGLLLQPSPSKVDILIPLTPGCETEEVRVGGVETDYFQDRLQSNGTMKKFAGDVRRVLSSRKGRRESPSSSQRSMESSDSRYSGHTHQHERNAQPSAWQQLQGPPRVDRLGEKIEESYREVFHDPAEPQLLEAVMRGDTIGSEEPESRRIDQLNSFAKPHATRLDSHVTTGSRSIVIMDDTGVPEMPVVNRALPSVSSWASAMAPKPLFPDAGEAFDDIDIDEWQPRSGSLTAVGSETKHSGESAPPKHDLFAATNTFRPDLLGGKDESDYVQARKSSNVHPSAIDLAHTRHELRRRPGGDLKAADHVHDLELAARPLTDDSYSTFSQAITSGVPSHELSLSGTHFSGQKFVGLNLPGRFESEKQEDSLGLLPTHSSQPNMRPSFEKQVSNLRQLSDRQYHGGIEDALAKLEGKTSPASESSTEAQVAQQRQSAPSQVVNVGAHTEEMSSAEALQLRSPRTDRQGASIYVLTGSDSDSGQFVTTQVEDGVRSVEYNAITTDDLLMHGTDSAKHLEKPVKFTGDFQGIEHITNHASFEEAASDPKSGTPKGSFLLDDNESLSDISTEIADQSGDESLGVRSFLFDENFDDELVTVGSFRPPSSPPSTVEQIATESPARSPVLSPALVDNKRPLKEASSAPKVLSSSREPHLEPQQKLSELRRVVTSPAKPTAAHLPFVLAFESEVIAEQLTIIEKDALDEVDWKDLISLNWQQTPSVARNWVDFLQNETNGIDIVIARFNLVVKWVVSECLLTEAPSERARCITKYIHIASHCHRLRNYASLYQMTLALLSSDLARLHETWSLVPPPEKQTLERLEKLCQPLRNFHHLRAEMEAASTEKGCIPFIGLYTHDLMFNAQKPAQIDSMTPGKEKLINFERYQTAATIVKGLLRLIEASSKYTFRPHPEVLSRCLWLAALDDAEILSRSKTMEVQ